MPPHVSTVAEQTCPPLQFESTWHWVVMHVFPRWTGPPPCWFWQMQTCPAVQSLSMMHLSTLQVPWRQAL
jgi:hypothetical protein